jgi:hypothetical protein
MAERRDSEKAEAEMAEVAFRRADTLGHPVIAVGFVNGDGFQVFDVGEEELRTEVDPDLESFTVGELLQGWDLAPDFTVDRWELRREHVGSVPFERSVDEIGLEDTLEDD